MSESLISKFNLFRKNKTSDTNDNLPTNENSYKIVKEFKTVDDMKKDTTLTAGDICITFGYYNINDGGGAKYIIDSTNVFPFESLSNSLFANQILEDKKLNVLSIGVRYFSNNQKYKSENSNLILQVLANNNWRQPFVMYFPFKRNKNNTATMYYLGNIDVNSLDGTNKMLNIEIEGEASSSSREYVQIATEGDN